MSHLILAQRVGHLVSGRRRTTQLRIAHKTAKTTTLIATEATVCAEVVERLW
jgi:hypothetical protein